jgi:hypothetical protein
MTLSGQTASQQPNELARFIGLIQGCRSYLEIGARQGDTFYEVCKAIQPEKALAVDLPFGPWGTDSELDLTRAVDLLRADGIDARCIFGSSQDPSIIKYVWEFGPFDCVLIDGDHRYEGVRQDYEHFACPVTAFHDICSEGFIKGDMKFGVAEFWREIRGDSFIEIIDPSDNRPMGIGVLNEDCDSRRLAFN